MNQKVGRRSKKILKYCLNTADKPKQIKNEAEYVKPNKSGDDQQDLLVAHTVKHEETVKDHPVVRKKHAQLRKAPKSPGFVNTGSHDCGNDNEE